MAAELTAVVAALSRELMYLWPHGRGWRRVPSSYPAWRGQAEGRELLVVASGMGRQAAARAARWLLLSGQPVAEIISIGFAGALTELPIGTLIEPAVVLDEQGASFPLAGPAGRLVTVSGVSGTPQERQALRGRTGADAVDMETFAVVRECRARGVPVRCLRAISDTPGRPIPPDLAPSFSGEGVNFLSLAWAVLRRPWRVLDLWRLAQDSAAAARVLADALLRALKCPTPSC